MALGRGVKELIKRISEAIAKLTHNEAVVMPKHPKGTGVQLPLDKLKQLAKTESEENKTLAKTEKLAEPKKNEKGAQAEEKKKVAGSSRTGKIEECKGAEKTEETERITVTAETSDKEEIKKDAYYRDIEKGSNVAALRALEALRFGLVPYSYIENITVGYESFKEWITPRMPHNCGNKACIYEVSGPFGMGKSHTIAVMRHLAITNGYLYAKVEADARTLSFAYPEILLYNLWLSLEGPDYQPEYPLLELYLKAMEKGHDKIPSSLEDNELFRENFEFISKLKNKSLLEKYHYLLDEALTGSDTVTATQIITEIGSGEGMTKSQIKFQPLKRRNIQEQAELLVISLVGHCLIAVAAGYKGLIIAIDEFEAHSIMSPDMQERTAQVIHNINEYISDKTSLPQSPLGLCFATIGQDGAPSDKLITNLIDDCGGHRYILKPWSKEQRIITAKKIYELYRESYNTSENFNSRIVSEADELLESKGFSDTEQIRGFIKCYLALLDMEYCPARQK